MCAGFFVLCSLACAQETPSYPSEELRPLKAALDKETQALEILRRSDKAQRKLIEWDRDMVQWLLRIGDNAAAQTKAEESDRRTRLLVEAYEIFLAAYPNNAKAHNYYGEVLYDFAGDPTKALQAWKLAEQLDPNLGIPANNMAIHYCHAGDYHSGFRYLDKALRLEPDNPDYNFNAAQIYLTNRPQAMALYKWDEKRLFKEAMKRSKRATQASPDDYSLAEDYAVNFFASMHLPTVKVNWNEAADAWIRARLLARDPDKVFFTWLNEARASIQGKNLKRAEQCLLKALELRPDNDLCARLLNDVRTGQSS